ncbi:unnamed protein product [Dibothriocephalus latus]|uniref:P-type ATPase C-terminal domain-containing protein n=1 Tax=Dibothriocephalus latus TaxID=60516 RepID=A0A3P7LJA8_DIBLA|nr:unnamed protein product [Dibothriocephalus latus]
MINHRHLRKLFLVHGQWNYYRMTFMALLFYHKCVALVACQIYQLCFSGFSAQPLFDSLLYALYNLTMTSCSVTAFGLFERHLTERDLMRYPFLYRLVGWICSGCSIWQNRRTDCRNANYNPGYVILYCLDGWWLGTVCYFLGYFVLVGGGIYGEATFVLAGASYATLDVDLFGTAVFLYLTIAVNFRCFVISRTFTMALIIGNLLFGIGNFIRLTTPISIFYMNLSYLAYCPAFWLGLPLTLCLSLMPDVVWRLGSDYWWKQQIAMGCGNSQARGLKSPSVSLTEI